MKCVRCPKRHKRCTWQSAPCKSTVSVDAIFSTQKYRHMTLRCGMLPCHFSPENNPSQDSPLQCLSEKLSHLGLKPLDVGGSGGCFFKAVSHQLYQTPALHARVRMAGIDHLNTHSELFRKHVINNSRESYIVQMSKLGTWCDNIIIQAVANALNCVIHITQSNNHDGVIITPNSNTSHENRSIIFFGHIPEVHYVSTVENHPRNGIRLRRIILETECAKIDHLVQQRESQKIEKSDSM